MNSATQMSKNMVNMGINCWPPVVTIGGQPDGQSLAVSLLFYFELLLG